MCRKDVPGHRYLYLNVSDGDPATFGFTINGQPARIAGAPAQAVTVRITRDNYTQFLSR